jgi:hypothetical protein
MLLAKFPFVKVGRGPLGEISRPYAKVSLLAEKRKKWLPANFVVDSGADYTLLPRIYASALGISLGTDCIAETSLGVGGSETVYLYKKGINMRVGDWQQRIPVGFLERDDVPPLMGRLGCTEGLRIVFENYETRFEK